MSDLPKLPDNQVVKLFPPHMQFGQEDCFILALSLLGGRATDCEAQLAMYILHRLGICNLHVDWRYKPCTWVSEDHKDEKAARG